MPEVSSRRLVIAICLVVFVSAAPARPSSTNITSCDYQHHLHRGTHVFLRLLPIDDRSPPGATEPKLIVQNQEPAEQKRDISASGNFGKPLGYTRLSIEYSPCASAQDRDLPAEQRGLLKQHLFGKQVNKDLTVKATINPLGVSQTRQLVLLNRDSSSKGESWNSQIGNSQQLTRYFLVDTSTTVSLEMSFNENSKYMGAPVGAVLDIVQRAATLIAPTTTLITTENKKRFNDASTFVDTTINGLLAREVKEKATVERAVSETTSGQILARIVLFVPEANSVVSKRRTGYRPIGLWTVRADKIIKAMFGVEQSGSLVRDDLSAPTIMSFKVDDNQTLAQFLAGQTSVSTAKDAYLKDSGKKGAAEALCSAISLETAKLGLSPADVGGATWAYARVLEPVDQAKSPLQTACSYIDNYPELKVVERR